MTPPRSARAATLVAILVWAMVVSVTATAMNATNSTSTNTTIDTSATATLAPSLTCARVNTSADACDVQSICARCVRTPGCAFSTLVRSCVALPDDGSALNASSANAPLNRTNYYCADDDVRCASCAVSTSNPICKGADGACVCPSVCDVLSTAQLSCQASRRNNTIYLAVTGLAAALAAGLWLYYYFARGGRGATVADDMRAGLRRVREELRLGPAPEQERERGGEGPGAPAQQPARAPGQLQLDTWRARHGDQRAETENVELTGCYVAIAPDGDTAASTNGAAATTRGGAENATPVARPP